MNTECFVFDLFLESKVNPIYVGDLVNSLTGKTIVSLVRSQEKNKSNTLLIKDIPDYLQPSRIDIQDDKRSKAKTVKQYKGYLIDLTKYTTVEEYLNAQLSKRNNKNLFAKQRKLYATHQIGHKNYFGEISKSEYTHIFKVFYTLLKRRFEEKKVYNKFLREWDHIYQISYDKILNKEASLFVIYDKEKPITISLNYHLGDIFFSHIQTYDIDYSDYNLGDIHMLSHLRWCIEQKIALIDLSMGTTAYKLKWCNHQYTFLYQIFYSKKKWVSALSASAIVAKLKLKQYLRDKGIIGKYFDYNKFFYRWRKRKINKNDWNAKR